VYHALVANYGENAPARVEVTALGERDQTLGERPQSLGLGLGGGDPPVLE
jgi:hypothetical protein